MRRYLIGLMCLPALTGCGHGTDEKVVEFRKAASELPKVLDDVKEAGISTSWDSLDHHIPSKENGASAYNLAFASMYRTVSKKLPLGNLDGLEPTEVFDVVKANVKVIAQLKNAAKYKHCDFGNPRTSGIGMPYFASMGIGARILALEARYKTERRDFSGALTDIQALVAMQRHSGESGFTAGLLMEVGISRISSETAQRMIEDAHAEPTVALALYNELAKEDPRLNPARLLASEIVANYDLINNHYEWLSAAVPDPADFGPVEEAVKGIPVDAIKAALTTRFLQLDLKLLKLAKDKTLSQTRLYEQEEQAIYSDLRGDQTYALNKAGFCETDSRICEDFLRYTALRNVTLAGLRIIADHKPGEAWPKSLPTIGMVDPFNNQPLRYRCWATGFSVYSVGPDLKDNIGATEDSPYGLSFRYPYSFVK